MSPSLWLARLLAWRAWIFRAILALALLSWFTPPRPSVKLGPPQTVVTKHPIVCVHTRLTDEVEAWKVLRTLEMVRQMGAPTIVEYFPWAYAEGRKGEFGWAHADMVVADAENQG